MVSKANRLSRKDFLLTKKYGKKFSAPDFSLVIHKTSLIDNIPNSRFSVVTSAKLSKKAVIRNRLRRLIYDSLKANSYKLKADVIVYPKPSMLNFTREEIGSRLDQFVSKIYS